ncbi:hypothetical protein V1478_018361 [Vespula squamosa]|uniref:Uncharacterized protein n=1 Tax=Vespula squamosa TaxID=30214 RepID=A0ABD1ZUU3_VESSQ
MSRMRTVIVKSWSKLYWCDCCKRDINTVATAGPLVYPHNKLQSQITESNSFGVFARNVAISAPREGIVGPGLSTKREGNMEGSERGWGRSDQDCVVVEFGETVRQEEEKVKEKEKK